MDRHHLPVFSLPLGAGRCLADDGAVTFHAFELLADEACSNGVVGTVHDVVL